MFPSKKSPAGGDGRARRAEMPITARENKKPGVSSGNNPSPVKEGLLIRILWYSPAREETTARESEGHEQAFP